MKQNNVILKQRNEEKDVKIQQLGKEITHLKEQNVGLTKRFNEVQKTMQALKKQVEILGISVEKVKKDVEKTRSIPGQ